MDDRTRDEFLQAAIAEAEQGLREGGIPIGSVLVHRGRIIGRGHNRRVQQGSAIRHGEMDALENAGRQPASVYRESVIYTTLSPCAMCSGAILLYGIPRVVVGENQTFLGEEALLRSRGVSVDVVQDPRCVRLMTTLHPGESGRVERGHRHVRLSRMRRPESDPGSNYRDARAGDRIGHSTVCVDGLALAIKSFEMSKLMLWTAPRHAA